MGRRLSDFSVLATGERFLRDYFARFVAEAASPLATPPPLSVSGNLFLASRRCLVSRHFSRIFTFRYLLGDDARRPHEMASLDADF